MHFQNIFVQVTSFFLLTQGLVHALPADTTSLEERATVPCDDISKYSVEWFLGNTCKQPSAASCLFYTRGLSKKARDYAKSSDVPMTTIWELWPGPLYNNNVQTSANPLRCIIQDKTTRRQYFSNMSQAMAEMCSVFASVMDPDIHNVRQDGIWGQVEFPTLQRWGNMGQVDQIEAMTPDGGDITNIWSRNPVKEKRYLARGPDRRRDDEDGMAPTCDDETDPRCQAANEEEVEVKEEEVVEEDDVKEEEVVEEDDVKEEEVEEEGDDGAAPMCGATDEAVESFDEGGDLEVLW